MKTKKLTISQVIKKLEKLELEIGDIYVATPDLAIVEDVVYDKFNGCVVLTDNNPTQQ